MRKRIAVIGAGLGGLSAAIRLQARGWQVSLFEKNERPGGRMNLHEEKGFKADMGPTLVMMPEMLEEVFAAAGKKMKDYLELIPLSPSYQVRFGDGSTFNMTSSLPELFAQLERRSPADAARFSRYFHEIEKKFRISRRYFIERPFNSLGDFLNWKTLKGLVAAKPFGTVRSFTEKYIRDPHLRAAFTFQTLYLGISPDACPSVYALLPFVELAYGVWYPKGGVFQIARALEKVFLEIGGEIFYRQPVEALILERKKVRGVVAGGKKIFADAVVCNQDVGAALLQLVPEKLRRSAPARKIEKLDYGCSSFLIYLGVNRKYPQVGHHTVVLPENFDAVLKKLFQDGVPPQEPAYYVCRPTATDPGLAPAGGDLIYVLVPVPHLQKYSGWSPEQIQNYRNTIVAEIENKFFPGLRSHIVMEKIFTPLDFQSQYQILHGSAFGLSPKFFQSAYFRPRNASPDLQNLFFAGASAHPGGGIPVVLLSGRLAADEISRRYPTPQPAVSFETPAFSATR